MPLVAVVLPTYNRARLVPRALQSVVDQTRTDWDLIVVDDCSTDDTPKVLEQWEARDPRIRALRRARNSGGCWQPRNDGIAVAESRYFAYIDDDNVWRPRHLELLVQAAERFPELGLAYGDRLCHLPDGTTTRPTLGIDTGDVLHPAEVWKAVPEGWAEHPTRPGQDDQYLWERIRAHYADLFVHVNEVISDYYLHGGNYFVKSPQQ